MTVNVNTSPPDFIKSTTCLWVAPSTFTLFLQRDHALSSGRRRNIHEYIRIHLFIPITDRFVSRVKIRSAPFTIVHPLVLHSGHVTRQHLLFFFFLSRVCERERERDREERKIMNKAEFNRKMPCTFSLREKYNYLFFRRPVPTFATRER